MKYAAEAAMNAHNAEEDGDRIVKVGNRRYKPDELDTEIAAGLCRMAAKYASKMGHDLEKHGYIHEEDLGAVFGAIGGLTSECGVDVNTAIDSFCERQMSIPERMKRVIFKYI